MAQFSFLGVTLALDTSAARDELHRRSIEREAAAIIRAEQRRAEVDAAKARIAEEATRRAAEVEATLQRMRAEASAASTAPTPRT